MAIITRESNMYLVKWRSRLTGYFGQSAGLVNLETAKAWVEKCSREYPDIEHWYESVIRLAVYRS